MKNVVIITGASSGIGKAMAYEFGKQAYRLVLAARRLELLEKIKEDLIAQFETEVLIRQTDVSKESDCKALIEESLVRFGKIDVLINNAGISQRALFNELELKDFTRIMDINYWGSVYCTKYALPSLLENRGSVISINSISGYTPLPGRTAYCSSKYALRGFMEALRIENRENGLHVLTVAPGFTASEIREKAVVSGGGQQGKSPRNESKMMQAETVARRVRKGYERKKRTVLLSPMGILAIWMSRLLPELMDYLIYLHMKQEDSDRLRIFKR